MKGSDIKTELRDLIEKENDTAVLEAIKILLMKSSLDPELKKKLTDRAVKADEDIVTGRVNSRAEIESKLNARLGI
jgi:hypothetical protein